MDLSCHIQTNVYQLMGKLFSSPKNNLILHVIFDNQKCAEFFFVVAGINKKGGENCSKSIGSQNTKHRNNVYPPCKTQIPV